MFKNKKLTILIIFILSIGFIILYGIVDPSTSIFFPKCIFYVVTGLECPGCGSQRAIHALLNAEFAKAFAINPLIVTTLPYFIITFTAYFFKDKYNKARRLYEILTNNILLWFLVVIFILYFIYRNFLQQYLCSSSFL